MRSFVSGLAVLLVLAAPVAAQPTSQADVLAQCISTSVAQCNILVRAYLATLPPAQRMAAHTAIMADLQSVGIVVAVAPPVGGVLAPATAASPT